MCMSVVRRAAIVAALCVFAMPAAGQNLLLNPGFEGGTGSTPDDWTVDSGYITWADGTYSAGSIDPYEGSRFVVVASTFQSASATISQNVGLPNGAGTYSLTLLFRGYTYETDDSSDEIRGRLIVDGAEVASTRVSTDTGPNQWWLAELTWTGTVNTDLAVQFDFSASSAGGYSVTCLDDVVLSTGQHTVESISPTVAADSSSDVSATITGTNLTGVDSVDLVPTAGGATISASGITVAGDGLSLTATVPITGAAAGRYDVVVGKTNEQDYALEEGFTIRDPAVPNQMLNGDFETGDLTAWSYWARNWGKGMAHAYVGDSSDSFIFTPELDGVETPTFDAYSVRVGDLVSDQMGGDGGVSQTINVIPGESLVLEFQWGGGSLKAGALHEVAVSAGATSGFEDNPHAAPLAAQTLVSTENSGGLWIALPPVGEFGWQSIGLPFDVPADVNQVTVYVRTRHIPYVINYNGQDIATWADNVVVRTQESCPDQHDTTAVDGTAVFDALKTFDLTVSGTNMDQVTGIRLLGQLAELTGQITSSSSTSLTATFTSPPGGVPAGLYDVVTEQSGCQTDTLADVVELQCLSTVDTVSPVSLEKPQDLIQLTLTGQNMDLLQTVSLEWNRELRFAPHPQTDELTTHWLPEFIAAGTIIDQSDPSIAVVEFDVTGFPIGNYNILATFGDVCDVDVMNAFELQLPSSGTDLLVNGGFESGAFAPGWVMTPADVLMANDEPAPGPEVAYAPAGTDWTLWFQIDADDNGILEDVIMVDWEAPSGDYFAGTAAGRDEIHAEYNFTPNGGTISQTITDLPAGAGDYQLTLAATIRLWDQLPNGPAAPTRMTMEILIDEGLPSETSVSRTAQMDEVWDHMSRFLLDEPYTPISVDYYGQVLSTITARITTMTDAEAVWSPPAAVVVVDDVKLISVASCNDPWADADADGDVDQEDFAVFQECFTGVDTTIPGDAPAICSCFDRAVGDPAVRDNKITTEDFQAFEACASGPDVPASNCN